MKKEMLYSLIKKQQWFCINSITFGDGVMTLFDMTYYSGEFEIRFIADTTVDSFLSYNPDDFFDFDIFCRTEYKGFEIFAGDGGYESDGYICVLNKEEKRLEWFLFFDDSTPFHSIEVIEDGLITARAKNNVTFDIPIDNPKALKLRYPQNK